MLHLFAADSPSKDAKGFDQRAPLRISLPTRALPFYFPNLYDASVLGEGFRDPDTSTHD